MRVIALVDENARQNLRVQLDMPGAVLGRVDIDVGNHRDHRPAAVATPGLGVEPADLHDHVAKILLVNSADLPKRGEVAPGQKRQVVEQRLHGGVETVLFA